MPASDCIWQTVAVGRRARLLEARWQKLCAVYLPRASRQSLWRASPASRYELPRVGWKLHISATILNAPAVLKRVAPFLIERGVQFKAPRSLSEVQKLNAGLDYSYSQIGKIITVYPRNDREAVYLARHLHRLTARFAAPSVPFDLQFGEQSNVYYRFGAFEHLEIDWGGEKKLATYDANGEVIPDVREEPKPDWVTDPFEKHRPISQKRPSSTNDRIRVLHALSQRGKGGVYAAVDVSGKVPQLCLLKEGRRHGEVSWDSRDGAWRIKNEARVLGQLANAGVPVPAIRSSFETHGDHYLVMDYLDGETLHRFLYRRRRRVPIARAVDFSLQLANFLSQMHAAGWVWRDCKPNNIIVTRAGNLVPIDFEGAAQINRPDFSKWGTPGFTPPEWRDRMTPSDKADDLYSLGAMIYLLLTGRIYESDEPAAVETLRRQVPPELRQLTRSLLSGNRRDRPSASDARQVLTSIWLKLKPRRAHLSDIKAA
jgi:serine/threonine protein kinase